MGKNREMSAYYTASDGNLHLNILAPDPDISNDAHFAQSLQREEWTIDTPHTGGKNAMLWSRQAPTAQSKSLELSTIDSGVASRQNISFDSFISLKAPSSAKSANPALARIVTNPTISLENEIKVPAMEEIKAANPVPAVLLRDSLTYEEKKKLLVFLKIPTTDQETKWYKKEFSEIKKMLSGVTALDLSIHRGISNISFKGIKALAAVLTNNETITTLNFMGNKIGPVGAEALAAVLKYTQITILHLGNNNIGPVGAAAIAAVLKYTQITTLTLGNNNIGDIGAADLAALLKYTQITTLILGNNNIGDVGAAALAEGLKDTKITTLILWNNNIGDVGASALAEWLKDTGITILHLWNNNIGDVGAAAIAAVLKYTQITTLNLGNNNIGDIGAAAIAAVLKDTQITTLNLWNNNIGDVGAAAIAAVLKDTQITSLDLGYNNMQTSIDKIILSNIQKSVGNFQKLYQKLSAHKEFIAYCQKKSHKEEVDKKMREAKDGVNKEQAIKDANQATRELNEQDPGSKMSIGKVLIAQLKIYYSCDKDVLKTHCLPGAAKQIKGLDKYITDHCLEFLTIKTNDRIPANIQNEIADFVGNIGRFLEPKAENTTEAVFANDIDLELAGDIQSQFVAA